MLPQVVLELAVKFNIEPLLAVKTTLPVPVAEVTLAVGIKVEVVAVACDAVDEND
jgi:hypothetical protein